MSNISTFGAFTTARLGIYASQKALEVVGNNIANINTAGYTRQSLDLSSLSVGGADRYQSSLGARVGSGALTTGVSQLRDPYLDIRFRNEQSSVGAMDAKLAGLEQLSSIFDEVGMGLDGEGVLEAQMNDLIEQLESLVTQGAGRDEYDALVRSSAASLTTLLNTYADKIETLMSNQSESFEQDIGRVNSILESIRDLNASIRKSQIHGGDALELKDQRNRLIDELSHYARISVTTAQEDIGGGMTVEKLIIRLAGNDPAGSGNNATLVDGTYATQLSIAAASDNFGIELAVPTDANGRPIDPAATATELGDNVLYGALQSSRELLTEKGEYASAADLAADPNASIKRGIPYYRRALDALASKLASVLNEANTMPQEEIYKTDGSGNFLNQAGDPTTDPAEYVLREEFAHYNGGALLSNSGTGDQTDGITAKNISISKSWAEGSVRVLASRQPHEQQQSTQNANLVHILYMMTSDQKYTPADTAALYGDDPADLSGTPLYTGSFQGMLNNIAATLANDNKTTGAMLENYAAASDELYVARESVSGVDLNDEAMGMMQYQKSYAAACRLMTTLDEMLDKLINGTGRAGL